MANILHIQASPRPESFSARLADEFIREYRQSHPADNIELLDMFEDKIPPFLAPEAKGKYAVLSGQAPKDEAQAAWQEVINAIDHFKKFDKYILSSPMWNFSIPYRLKQYIDVIIQPGLTFNYSPETGYVGLVTGKPMMLLMARGGASYGPGDPRTTYDFQESYLRSIFGFIGFTDIKSVFINGTLQNTPEQLESDMQKALADTGAAAKAF